MKNVVSTTARATTKAARTTKAVRTTKAARAVVMVATMIPNGDEDNEDSNSKNNDKLTTKPTTTTEEDERSQSRRDNRGGGHRHPCDAAIAPTDASLRHTFVSGLRGLYSLLYTGIHRKCGKKSGNLDPKSGRPKNLERLAGQPIKIFHKKSKSRP